MSSNLIINIKDSDSLEFLFSLEKFGIKLGLQNTKTLLTFLGNPQNEFKSIHVAGTNGKGSTSSLIASILQENNFKVGLYTSPHLINFSERIKVCGICIDDHSLAKYINLVREIVVKLKLTFFEVTTCIAFKYFADQKVDFAIIETGLGGRLDSTNVLNPILSIITDISFDHTSQLGNSIKEIAYEKAGIIKPGVPCLTAVKSNEAYDVLKEISKNNNVELLHVRDVSHGEMNSFLIDSMGINVVINDTKFYSIDSPLVGEHQISNILLSILAVDHLDKNQIISLQYESIKNGIQNVRKNVDFRCRFELFKDNSSILIDVAHNLDSIQTLVSSLKVLKFKRIILIFGVMKDKNYQDMIQLLSTIIYYCIAVKPVGDRSLDTEEIIAEFEKFQIQTESFSDFESALDQARRISQPDDLILITGSHYVCGEFLKILK